MGWKILGMVIGLLWLLQNHMKLSDDNYLKFTGNINTILYCILPNVYFDYLREVQLRDKSNLIQILSRVFKPKEQSTIYFIFWK
jgi:hypothetical protein